MPYRLGLILLAPAAAFGEGTLFLRPAGETIVKLGPLAIIAKGEGELRMDGKPLAATSPAPGVVTATVTPAPGMHELSLGTQKVRFFAGEAGAPSGWKEFRAHPPAAGCDACHAVQDGAWEIKGGVIGDNCFSCHDRAPFPKTHQHNSEVLADCQLCHNPHGSTAKFHLKMAKETACKQCHA